MKWTTGKVSDSNNAVQCDIKIEKAITDAGYTIKGYRYNQNDTRYLLSKNDIDFEYLFARGNARADRIKACMEVVNDIYHTRATTHK